MKKIIFAFLTLILCILSFILISCDEIEDTTKPIVTYSITYELNGGTNSENNPDEYKTGDTVSLDFPIKENYMFAGWYTDSAFTTDIVEIKDIEEDLILYAKWLRYDDVINFWWDDELSGFIVESFEDICSVLIIPSTHNGHPVTGIRSYAIGGKKNIKTVFVPESVITIQERAFDGFSFNINTTMERIIVDDDNPNYKSIDGVIYSKDGKTLLKYPQGKKDISFEIPEGVTVIDEFAFAFCENIKEISFPSSLKEIKEWAFTDCLSLENITFSDGIDNIGRNAFGHCDSLTNVTIPGNIKAISYGMFGYCKSLKTVVIENGVTTINELAFIRCDNLERVVIPESVTVIKGEIFNNSPNTIVYCEAESKPDGWDDNWDRSVKEVIWGYKGE